MLVVELPFDPRKEEIHPQVKAALLQGGITPEELGYTDRRLNNKSMLRKVFEYTIKPLAEFPSNNPVKFFVDVVMHPSDFKVMSLQRYNAFVHQYEEHRRTCLEFKNITPIDFKEFLSCGWLSILTNVDKRGNAIYSPVFVDGELRADFFGFVNGRLVAIQVKNVEKFSSGDLVNLKIYYKWEFDPKQKELNDSFFLQVLYRKIERPEDMHYFLKQNPRLLPNNMQCFYSGTTRPVTEPMVESVLINASKNAKSIAEIRAEIQKAGWYKGLSLARKLIK